jgi:signal recognition particle GTPase
MDNNEMWNETIQQLNTHELTVIGFVEKLKKNNELYSQILTKLDINKDDFKDEFNRLSKIGNYKRIIELIQPIENMRSELEESDEFINIDFF